MLILFVQVALADFPKTKKVPSKIDYPDKRFGFCAGLTVAAEIEGYLVELESREQQIAELLRSEKSLTERAGKADAAIAAAQVRAELSPWVININTV